MKMKSEILHELKEHVPFTAAATLIAVLIMSFLLVKENLILYSLSLFHVFHPAHIFFSSIVSAAIFYHYRKNIFLALVSSISIAIAIGSLSDIIFPYLGSLLFNIPISFHLPAIESPFLIFSVAILGSITGIIWKKTKFPHFIHVLISVFASLLYIFAYSANFSLLTIILIFIITTISVVIPCCLSDIVFPILFQNKLRKEKISHEQKISGKIKRRKPEVSSQR
ncbi:MAG: hypothetical protein Q7R52_00810 [archaeon]|nr:hypothetical protein [archaeon]